MATSVAKRQKAHAALQNTKRDQSPKWDGAESWSGDKFTAHFREAMSYYNLNHSGKDLKPKVIDWMGRNGYDRKTISQFKATKDSRCGITMGAVAACLVKGMPSVHAGFNNGKDTATWLGAEIAKIIEEGKEDEVPVDETKKVKVEQPVITIQDRLRETAGVMCEEIDLAVDNWIIDAESFDPKEFKLINLLRGKGAKAAHARFIKGFYQRNLDELLELASGNADEQLREAYKHNSRKNVKKLIEFYESIMTACDQIAAEAKVLKKPRAKKVKPAEDLIKKLKFCVKDDKLSIVSQPPAGIVRAQGVVIYNVKTRKMGYYISNSSNGLGVKGTTLTDYSVKSVQKTLRKPPEQIKEFKEQNTQKRFETWFDKTVKTTETQLNGRFNEDTVILKVFK